ncbi:hypothetical protein [Zunongwangia sp. HRR-M8]|uniref:hypothetical protein n=1 Tax=Zunongwangia sp. HRR-M8 TaxID=3015170 RepID=UPI0022DD401D|nr:hypothetical protein [Zunongwangia sp. HRR-M8]WBL23590.1 hypothetical protein PBT89_06445 [Zunongwangia sp. HRR-M8]
MKKIFTLLFATTFLFASCSDDGEPGPQGPQGPPGEDGLIGTTLEKTVTFTAPEYSIFYNFPKDVDVFGSDAVLVYLLEKEDDGKDVWTLLPQTFYLEGGGQMQYNYNHTLDDVNIYLQGNIALETLGEDFTVDQTFRIVIVPSGVLAKNNNIDISDYKAVMKASNIRENAVKKLD